MKHSLSILCLVICVAFYNCKPKQKVTIGTPQIVNYLPYKGSVTKINDLVHTKLDLEPDFEKKELKGTATITLRPHFYPTDSLTLNAKYMRIVGVFPLAKPVIINGKEQFVEQPGLKYTYDSLFLRIKLDRTYKKEETYTIIINYIAQPEKCKSEGGSAIKEDKGMYFINTDGKEKDKPVQIWTQGETEAASCWFPTIDAPNQKTTEEIIVTVPNEYRTISNGLLVKSEKVGDKKRKDHWKQDKPHAPYLFALIIGDFIETKDKWRDKNVNYYMEPAYAPYAKTVFGNTPKMLEFYSTILNYPYAWDKFDQVVVRDFVSGAMENTGCVVHFDKLNHTNREHLDNTYEDIIAHELFHHWFGDLVTCESWSNIPLNESFATYGEYLWNEHMYGRSQADLKFNEYLTYYFDEAETKQVEMIRYHYDKRDDLFDRHSYQKGGAILHMLRKYVGDEAFFKSLNIYLTKNAFKTAEINDLRMTFEEVTGEDLNWFFNQWFMEAGHPSLAVKHQVYNGSGEIYGITIIQNGEKIYKLPVDIDVYTNKGIERHRIMIEKDSQTFGFTCSTKPITVVFDAEHQLLSEIKETKSIQAWESQLKYANLSAHKINALTELNKIQNDKSQKIIYNKKYLTDSFWKLRQLALKNLSGMELTDEELKPLLPIIEEISTEDPKSDVRIATVDFLETKKDEYRLEKMLSDSSYGVVSAALQALGSINKESAYLFSNRNREEKNSTMQGIVFYTLGRYSMKDEIEFFINHIKNGNKATVENATTGLIYFLVLNQTDKLDDALKSLDLLVADPLFKDKAIKTMKSLRTTYSTQLYYLNLYKDIDKDNKSIYEKRIKEVNVLKKKVEVYLLKNGEPLTD